MTLQSTQEKNKSSVFLDWKQEENERAMEELFWKSTRHEFPGWEDHERGEIAAVIT